GAATDRTGRAVLALDAVAGAQAREAVALHDTVVALAVGLAGHVDQLTRRERLDRYLLAELVRAGVDRAQLDEVAWGRGAGLREVAGLGLVDLPRVDRAEGQLDSRVAVLVSG